MIPVSVDANSFVITRVLYVVTTVHCSVALPTRQRWRFMPVLDLPPGTLVVVTILDVAAYLHLYTELFQLLITPLRSTVPTTVTFGVRLCSGETIIVFCCVIVFSLLFLITFGRLRLYRALNVPVGGGSSPT